MIKIVYIAGDGRSGSTLLDSVISNVDNSISIGECHRFWLRFYEAKSACGCGEPIKECVLWSQVHQDLTEAHKNYNPSLFLEQVREIQLYKNFGKIHDLLLLPEWRQFGEIVTTFYTSIATHANCSVLVDSSKSMAWAALLLHLNFADVKVVHLERSLPAVANSWKKEMTLPEYKNETVLMPTKSNIVIIKSWLKIKYMSNRLKKMGPYFFLSYEALCKEPAFWIEQLKTFTGLQLPLDSFTSQPNHAIGGNPMRAGLSDHIKIKPAATNFNLLTTMEKVLFRLIYKLSKLI